MQNKKDKILDQIKEIDKSVHLLNTQKESLYKDYKQLEFEENKQKLHVATSSNPLDWTTILSLDNYLEPLPGAINFINGYLNDHSKNVKTSGHYEQSKQIGIHFLVSKNMDTDSFTLKLAPILKTLKPIHWKDGYAQEVAIPLIDKLKGTEGSYSLLINGQRLGRVVKVSGNKVEFKTAYLPIKQALDWAKKNCYYYG